MEAKQESPMSIMSGDARSKEKMFAVVVGKKGSACIGGCDSYEEIARKVAEFAAQTGAIPLNGGMLLRGGWGGQPAIKLGESFVAKDWVGETPEGWLWVEGSLCALKTLEVVQKMLEDQEGIRSASPAPAASRRAMGSRGV